MEDEITCPECGSSRTSFVDHYGWVKIGHGPDEDREEREVYEYRCNEPDCGQGFLVDDQGFHH